MANTAFHGKDGAVYWNNAVVANITGWNLTINGDLAEKTAMAETNGYKVYAGGHKDWQATLEANLDASGPNIALAQLAAESQGGGGQTYVELWMQDEYDEGIFFGSCILASANPSNSKDDVGKFSASIQGNGQIQFTVAENPSEGDVPTP